MLTGESPFLGDDKQETFLNISQVNVDYSQDTFDGISTLAVDFIKSMLLKNPRWGCLLEIYPFWLDFLMWQKTKNSPQHQFEMLCTTRMWVRFTPRTEVHHQHRSKQVNLVTRFTSLNSLSLAFFFFVADVWYVLINLILKSLFRCLFHFDKMQKGIKKTLVMFQR